MVSVYRFCLLFILCAFCVSCLDDAPHYAPVVEINGAETLPQDAMHQVKKGESLYAIAFRYALDYRSLARYNDMHPPYTIVPGARLRLKPGAKVVSAAKIYQPSLVEKPQKELVAAVKTWQMPAQGKISFHYGKNFQGIGIANKISTPVVATAAGLVVYAGNGLRSYGNLIIIKHNALYLSAYAHNQRMLVKEGDYVVQGQKIAEMGKTRTGQVLLYFEIRKAGKPLNPLLLLGSY